jgi:two-component system, response regulator
MSRAVDILVIEENPDDLPLIVRALQAYPDMRISAAQAGAEALGLLFGTAGDTHRRPEDRPKVILLDLKLPKVSGLERLQCLRADPHTQTISVMVLTSSGEERAIVESYRLGANRYLTKPVDFALFTKAVQQVGHYWLQLNRPAPG